ncbi:MAG: branched-chain amino acid aminotransferase, partial [Betaproteobacteria bacterium]|nr:branched-chain amino acid aminotransferase [Betaproteobacteria bacterium]
MWFYLNGRFVEDQDAKVSVTDHSFLYGDGCFEGIGVCSGRVLHLDEHVARLFKSARLLRMQVPVTPPQLRGLILETASRNGMDKSKMGYLRPLLSRGAGPLGLKYSNKLGPATLVIIPQIADRRIAYTGEIEVFSAAFSTYSRAGAGSLDARIKANNYLTYIMAFLEAQDRGADIAILRDPEGYVAEGHAMNLFCVHEGRVLVPSESLALSGITRKNVIATARRIGYACTEAQLTRYDLTVADEVFVTSSLEAIAAVGSIHGEALSGPVLGPV